MKGNQISWAKKKQRSIALLNAKVKYNIKCKLLQSTPLYSESIVTVSKFIHYYRMKRLEWTLSLLVGWWWSLIVVMTNHVWGEEDIEWLKMTLEKKKNLSYMIYGQQSRCQPWTTGHILRYLLSELQKRNTSRNKRRPVTSNAIFLVLVHENNSLSWFIFFWG